MRRRKQQIVDDPMQISLFDVIAEQQKSIEPVKEKEPLPLFEHLRKVGDRIGKVVLGELRTATITLVEGLPRYPFYRTDSGCCYSYQDGIRPLDELQKEADDNRPKYKTIEPKDLSERLTVEYAPRSSDGKVLWAQIGIYQNMLFWKEEITYQFLEPYPTEKALRKAYNEKKKKILDNMNGDKLIVLDEEKPMRRLYWSKHGFFADAEYVRSNG